MKAIPFKEQTATAAKDQPEYLPLPCHISNESDGIVTACWKMNFRERITALFTGKIWVQLMCFHKPITPSKISIFKPEFINQ